MYDEFKKDFFPGEVVHVFFDDGDQFWGQIREKAKFPMIRGPDGEVQRPAFSRYFVRVPDTPGQEALIDDGHMRRDRKVFTKQNLRAFLKNSLQRESWHGAPWLVKEHLAIRHRLPMEIPAHLMQDAKLLANKVRPTLACLTRCLFADAPQQLLQMRPPKGRRSNRADEIQQQQHLAHMQQVRQSRSHIDTLLTSLQHPGALHQQLPPGFRPNGAQRAPPASPPPPPIKYPIEDLEYPHKIGSAPRPQLKFLTDEQKDYIMAGRRIDFEDISLESVGLLLEVWNTLNVQCEVYKLDSFTFDDFVDAMRYKELDPQCELLEEAHCAVLSQLVDKSGKTQVVGGMAALIEELEDAHSDAHDEIELSTPQPDVPARSTRSRLSHVDPNVDNPRSPTNDKAHRAAELMGDRGWKTRIAAREYQNGGWQVILVGFLHQLSANPSFKMRCEKILTKLVPIDEPPSNESVQEHYADLDVNLRISALQMITIMSISTTAIKTFLETCSEDMTEVRKRKIEHQRERKQLIEELHAKEGERKVVYGRLVAGSGDEASKNGAVENGSAEPASTNSDVDDTMDTNASAESPDPDDDEPPTSGRSLRRASDRKRKRDEEAAKREREKAEKLEAQKESSKDAKLHKKLVKEVEQLNARIKEHEDKINDCDADLREANVQRTKVLGKDRYCNRYYWFERNGQPFGGLPRSSTADYGYANGRIWVQGPDDMEADGFINLPPNEQKEYRHRHGLTVLERRKKEEGETSLLNAQEWGFYDAPSDLDQLIGWLDEHGEREKKLRKELIEWREMIAQYMDVYRKFFDDEATKRIEAEEELANRVSTRHKVQEETAGAKERCLRWTNSMALDAWGHIHSRPERKSKRKAAPAEGRKGVATLVSRTTGKSVTRQGGNYSFK